MGRTLRSGGFTLMELMTALAVIGVVLAITVPSFNTFRLNNRMTGAANDLLAALNIARSEAIKRQRAVGLCTSIDPDAGTPGCTGALADGTAVGWVVWLDANTNATPDAGEEVFVRHRPLDAALNVTTNWQTVSYAPTGFPQMTPTLSDGSPAAVLLCDERGDDVAGDQMRKRILTVSRTGRPGIVRTVPAVETLVEATEDLDSPPETNCN